MFSKQKESSNNFSESHFQPVNSQSSPKASKNNKQDVKPSSSPNASSPMPIRSSKSILSRRTSSNLSPIGILKNASIREAKSPKTSSSPKWTCNFILMVELRRKIITFRDIIDLPPLDGSPTITDVCKPTKFVFLLDQSFLHMLFLLACFVG